VFIPYTLGDGSFLKALYCSVLVLIKNLSFYDSLEIENGKRKISPQQKFHLKKKFHSKKKCSQNFSFLPKVFLHAIFFLALKQKLRPKTKFLAKKKC
jgi:hypothetical protein